MKIAILSITDGGTLLAKEIAQKIGADYIEKNATKLADRIAALWNDYDGFICIMASGIVVRSIAPLLKDKAVDPAVLVLDEKGKNVISLLSGHLGGGNALTLQIAELIGANPVITTASDTLELTALDLWAKENNLVPPIRKELTALSARLVNCGRLYIYYQDNPLQRELIGELLIDSAEGLFITERREEADCIISHTIQKRRGAKEKELPQFYPKDIIIGVGCNRGTPKEEFEEALSEILEENSLCRQSICNLASIDLKDDETGLLQFGEENGWHIDFFSREEINTITGIEISNAALKAVGAIGVAEPASLLSAKSKTLLVRKNKWKNITMAIALKEMGAAEFFMSSAQGRGIEKI